MQIVDESKRRRYEKTLPSSEVRRHCVSARFNDAELEKLNILCSQYHMQNGEFLRATALSYLAKPIPEINKVAWTQLANIQSNLNQIAHKLNINETVDINELIEIIKIIRSQILLLKED